MTTYVDSNTGLLVLYKQPAEDTLYDIVMSGVMRDGDTISSFVNNEITQENMGIVTGSGDLTLGVPAEDATAEIAQVRISGGTDGEHYKLTCKVNTVGGDIRERDVMLYVQD